VDIEIKFEGGPSDGAHPKILVFMDPELMEVFHTKEGPQPRVLEVVPSSATI